MAVMDQRCEIIVEDYQAGRTTSSRAVRFDSVRAQRLILASYVDDDVSSKELLDGLDECPYCLQGIVNVVAGAASSLCDALGEGNRSLVLAQLQKQLVQAIDEQNAEI
jgi:hypothetical protein